MNKGNELIQNGDNILYIKSNNSKVVPAGNVYKKVLYLVDEKLTDRVYVSEIQKSENSVLYIIAIYVANHIAPSIVSAFISYFLSIRKMKKTPLRETQKILDEIKRIEDNMPKAYFALIKQIIKELRKDGNDDLSFSFGTTPEKEAVKITKNDVIDIAELPNPFPSPAAMRAGVMFPHEKQITTGQFLYISEKLVTRENMQKGDKFLERVKKDEIAKLSQNEADKLIKIFS